MLRLCKDAGLPAPEFEFRYIEGRAFAFDYAWPAPFKIALEQEGGFYGVGKPCRECGRRSVAGHTSIERLKTDQWKYNAAALLGWIVFRFQPAEVRAAKFLPWVRQAIEARKAWAR